MSRQPPQGVIFPISDIDNSENGSFKLEKENNELLLSWNRPAKPITLASDAYHGLTYTDLFVTKNLKTNSHFTDDLTGYTTAAGAPSVSTDDCNTPTKSLKIFGTTSQQVTTSVTTSIGAKLYIACKVKVNRFVSGGGIGIFATNGDYDAEMLLKSVTNEFVTVSHIFTSETTSFAITIGSISSANLDGYIDDFMVIDISSLAKYAPNCKELDQLYENYLNILKGAGTTTQPVKSYKIASKENWTCSAPEAEAEFVKKMREKALAIGMVNSVIWSSTGFTASTAYDLIKMAVHATGYNDIAKVWNKKTYTIVTKGIDPREIVLATTVTDSALETAYYIFGGKTGTGTAVQQSLVMLVPAPNGNMLVGAIAENSTDRFVAMKELFDIGIHCLDPVFVPPDGHTLTATNFAVALMPHGNPLSYEGYDIPLLYAANENTAKACASTAKVLTAMVMLDYVKDLNEMFEIEASDIQPASIVKAGDIISFKDALHAMLLPSANEVAKAISREVGYKILNAY